jgi:VWFA-related protein
MMRVIPRRAVWRMPLVPLASPVLLCVIASAALTTVRGAPVEQPIGQPTERAAGQPAGQPRFRTNAAGVSIDVLVTERGAPVAGLIAADFELTDRGVPQQIDVTTLEDRPIDVIVVIDFSPSLGERGLRHVIGATDTLLADLRKDDRAALVTFSQAVVIHTGLTAGHARIGALVRGLTLHGRTSVIDAVYAATTLPEAADRASLLLVFSDGVDNSSWLARDTVLDIVRRSSVVPYVVATVPRNAAGVSFGRAAGVDAAKLFLNDLVTTGGGVITHSEDTQEIERLFVGALDSFRHRYLLTYTPRGVDGAGWHPVTIKVKGGRGYRVQARSGYVVP